MRKRLLVIEFIYIHAKFMPNKLVYRRGKLVFYSKIKPDLLEFFATWLLKKILDTQARQTFC